MFDRFALALAIGLAAGPPAWGVVGLELTTDTWEAETAGKTVFVKFLAPW